jgi:hemolysin activation/secretion protein
MITLTGKRPIKFDRNLADEENRRVDAEEQAKQTPPVEPAKPYSAPDHQPAPTSTQNVPITQFKSKLEEMVGTDEFNNKFEDAIHKKNIAYDYITNIEENYNIINKIKYEKYKNKP